MNGILYTQNLNRDFDILTTILRKIEIEYIYYPKGMFTLEDKQKLFEATHVELNEIPEGMHILQSVINDCDFVLYSKESHGRSYLGNELVRMALKSKAPCIRF